jgi:hypothetical protein
VFVIDPAKARELVTRLRQVYLLGEHVALESAAGEAADMIEELSKSLPAEPERLTPAEIISLCANNHRVGPLSVTNLRREGYEIVRRDEARSPLDAAYREEVARLQAEREAYKNLAFQAHRELPEPDDAVTQSMLDAYDQGHFLRDAGELDALRRALAVYIQWVQEQQG